MAGGHETSPRQQKDTSQTEDESHNKAICHVRKTREAHIVSQVDHEDLVFFFFLPNKKQKVPLPDALGGNQLRQGILPAAWSTMAIPELPMDSIRW